MAWAKALRSVLMSAVGGRRCVVALALAVTMEANDPRADIAEVLAAAVADGLGTPAQHQGEDQETSGPRPSGSMERTCHRRQAIRTVMGQQV